MEEEWGFFLIDARNAINEINRTVMLWVLRRAWTSGARFCFNCYQHLVHQGAIGKSVRITRGDLPSMICSGIGILPLVRTASTCGTHRFVEQLVFCVPVRQHIQRSACPGWLDQT